MDTDKNLTNMIANASRSKEMVLGRIAARYAQKWTQGSYHSMKVSGGVIKVLPVHSTGPQYDPCHK